MAILRIHEQFTNLAADAPSVLTEGSGLDTVRHAFRQVIVDNLPTINDGSLSAASRQGLVSVSVELGADQDVEGNDPTTGFMDVIAEVVIADQYVYDFEREDGPVSAFIEAVKSGVVGAFVALPDFDAIVAGLGLGGATIRLRTSVRLAG
jgi:hypothetical protein